MHLVSGLHLSFSREMIWRFVNTMILDGMKSLDFTVFKVLRLYRYVFSFIEFQNIPLDSLTHNLRLDWLHRGKILELVCIVPLSECILFPESPDAPPRSAYTSQRPNFGSSYDITQMDTHQAAAGLTAVMTASRQGS